MNNNLKKGAIFMIVSALMFAVMQILIAKTADRIPLFEQLLFRNLVATFIALFFIKKEKLKVWGDRENRSLLLFRSLFGYAGMITLFFASGNGNQGDVTIILKMTPFVTIILAGIFLKEKIQMYKYASVLIAFLGLILVAGTQMNSDIIPLAVAFASTMFAGVAYTFVSILRTKERPWVIVFFFSITSTVLSAIIMVTTGQFTPPTLMEFGMLIGIGSFAAGGQIFMTKSYAVAQASEVSVFNYFGIIFSMILGAIVLGEAVAVTSILGAGLVVLAGVVVYVGSKKIDMFL